MIHFSEFVSPGHPDKIADYISQYLLDRYIEQDPNVRYAVEVQIKNSMVVLAGEISSKITFSNGYIEELVRKAVRDIGYTRDYQNYWGSQNTICADELKVYVNISQQSPDIAQGLSGWGDQGIFYGMAEYNCETEYMPTDYTYARRLCKDLFEMKNTGLDIKTQIVMRGQYILRVIAAVPVIDQVFTETAVYELIKEKIKGDYQLIVNGTGKYVQHGPIADCGTTGRKLAVDFYGGNCLIGGGSPWTKDGSKADLALNLYARKLAKQAAKENHISVYTSLACCIGKQEVNYNIRTANGETIEEGLMTLPPSEIIQELGLNKPIYASMCKWGLFGEYQQDKNWEK